MILTLPTHVSTKYIFQPSGVENVGNFSSKTATVNFIEFLSLIIKRLDEFYNFIWNPILSFAITSYYTYSQLFDTFTGFR